MVTRRESSRADQRRILLQRCWSASGKRWRRRRGVWRRMASSRGRRATSARAPARRLAADGLVAGTSGNVSARAGAHVAVSPTGAMLAELEAGQVTVVDLE